MALTEDRPTVAPGAPPPAADPRGFRPTSRRRARIAAGAALAAVAIGGNVLVYTSLDQTTEVLQVVDNIRAGDQIELADLRTVSVDVDDNVPAIPADQIGFVVGRYARTYIASGSLLVDLVLQDRPLVALGQSVIAIEVSPTAVPSGLLERSRVLLVVEPEDEDDPPIIVQGRVVSRPEEVASVSGRVSVSVELAEVDSARVVNADEIGIVLLDPGADPATEIATGTLDTIPGTPAADESPADESPADESPADESPADESPADDAPVPATSAPAAEEGG